MKLNPCYMPGCKGTGWTETVSNKSFWAKCDTCQNQTRTFTFEFQAIRVWNDLSNAVHSNSEHPIQFSGEVTGLRTVGDKTIVEVLVDEPAEVAISWKGKRFEGREAQK